LDDIKDEEENIESVMDESKNDIELQKLDKLDKPKTQNMNQDQWHIFKI